MKLNFDKLSGERIITGYGDDFIEIDRVRHSQNLLILPASMVPNWATGGLAGLDDGLLAPVVSAEPEIFLLATGTQQRFPDLSIFRPLMKSRIGFEVMTLGAACRTYNILIAESRKVAVGVLFS